MGGRDEKNACVITFRELTVDIKEYIGSLFYLTTLGSFFL
jgi:hypothetical protein